MLYITDVIKLILLYIVRLLDFSHLYNNWLSLEFLQDISEEHCLWMQRKKKISVK